MSIYGTKQSPTTRKSVSLDEEQAATIKANANVLDDAAELASNVSDKDTQTLMNQMESFLPGFSNLTGKAASVIDNYLSGQIDQGTQDSMARRAAERGISTGTGGSQFSGYGELSNYGTTMMQMQQQGLQMFQSSQDAARRMVNPMSATAMFQTPNQRAALVQSEADREASLMSHNNSLAAMGDPSAIAAAEDARMRQIAGIQTRNAVNMSNAANYTASMGTSIYESVTGRPDSHRLRKSGYGWS